MTREISSTECQIGGRLCEVLAEQKQPLLTFLLSFGSFQVSNKEIRNLSEIRKNRLC